VNYFSYVLIAIAYAGFIGTSIGRVAAQISQEQTMGTLEPLLTSPTRFETIVLAMITWDLFFAFAEFALYIIVGIFVFHINFSNANLLSVFVITLLSIISLKSLSVLSAGFVLVFKRGDPVSWLMSVGVELLGGVYFPVTVLPEWLRFISHLFPLTYSIRSVELAIYQGATLQELSADIYALLFFSLVFLPLGIIVLRFAVRRAKTEGSRVQY
jgi:ABC-2 type transport system permease protein